MLWSDETRGKSGQRGKLSISLTRLASQESHACKRKRCNSHEPWPRLAFCCSRPIINSWTSLGADGTDGLPVSWSIGRPPPPSTLLSATLVTFRTVAKISRSLGVKFAISIANERPPPSVRPRPSAPAPPSSCFPSRWHRRRRRCLPVSVRPSLPPSRAPN